MGCSVRVMSYTDYENANGQMVNCTIIILKQLTITPEVVDSFTALVAAFLR